MNDEDDDFVDFEGDDDASEPTIEDARMSSRAGRARRCWRDVERMREQKELDRLNAQESWFDELDRL